MRCKVAKKSQRYFSMWRTKCYFRPTRIVRLNSDYPECGSRNGTEPHPVRALFLRNQATGGPRTGRKGHSLPENVHILRPYGQLGAHSKAAACGASSAQKTHKFLSNLRTVGMKQALSISARRLVKLCTGSFAVRFQTAGASAVVCATAARSGAPSPLCRFGRGQTVMLYRVDMDFGCAIAAE